MKRATLMSMIALGCLSCSTVEEKEIAPAAKPTVTAPVAEDKCAVVSRNLRISWQERQYWCSPEYKRNPIVTGSKVKTSDKAKPGSKQKQYKSLTPAGNKPVSLKATADAKVERQLAEFLGKVYAGEYDIDGVKLAVKSYDLVADYINELRNDKVWFAANVEVLGINGAKTVEEIVSRQNKDNIKQVKLRGYASITADNKSKKGLDELAVGRALSVRELLAQNGIPKSKIKILYRNQDVNGRYVEVMVNEQASL